MNKKVILILLIGIIALATILRLWKLGEVPISPDWDEVALGYNAYSIMQTGRDEYGKLFPVILRSFDDYKPAFYTYFTIPSIAIFDLTVFSVRFPSAVFGVMTVFAIYFLIKELFRKEEIALLSSFLLAISPWHIQFSRIAFESNVGLSFNVFSVLFFIKGLKKPWFLVFSAFFMAINLYIYQSEKVFAPILLLAMIIIFRKELFSIPKKYIFLAAIAGLLISIPIVSYTITDKNALGRAKGVSVFSETTNLLEENAKKLIEDQKNNDTLGLLFDNRRIAFAKSVVSGYVSHFDLNWLFITGDIARHHAPNMGLLYLFELPFLLIGIYCLIFGNFDKKTKFLVLAWFLIAPIPASVTSGVPHAVRTLNFLPTFQIFTAIGILFALQKISNIKYKISNIQIKYFIYSFCFLFFMFNFLYYLNQYFVQQNYFNAKDWQYGYAQIIPEIHKIESNYSKIVVSNQEPMDQSYMFFLFYLKYSPLLYQAENKDVSGGFAENHVFGQYEFRPINWEKEEKNGKILYVGRLQDFPKSTKKIKEALYPNGELAIQLTVY
ncbi:MAG: glycosyltransferase family 39 protein [Candidatus Levybacteria bacterium]|nr:glycosyltransferase family 39 protein [Candidatus Levybacteria bacterium]